MIEQEKRKKIPKTVIKKQRVETIWDDKPIISGESPVTSQFFDNYTIKVEPKYLDIAMGSSFKHHRRKTETPNRFGKSNKIKFRNYETENLSYDSESIKYSTFMSKRVKR